jgi:hypothetical protein
MTGSSEWGLVKEAVGGISGVYSLSEGKPFKIAGFSASDDAFREATSYREWVFRFDFGKAEKDAQKAAASAKPAASAAAAPQPPAP